MTEFTIYKFAASENVAIWTGTVDSPDAPLAFLADMREFGPQMAVGDTLDLNKWHYAVKVA